MTLLLLPKVDWSFTVDMARDPPGTNEPLHESRKGLIRPSFNYDANSWEI